MDAAASEPGLDILVITPEAYGGFGGISVYNIDLVDALCALPYVRSVDLLPRLIRSAPASMPAKVRLITESAGGLRAFAMATARQIGQRHDVIVCAHMHLLPFARLAAAVNRARIVCVLYGTEAWVPTNRFLVNRLVRACDKLISISAFTKNHFLSWAQIDADRVELLPNCVHAARYGVGDKPAYLAARYGLQDCRVVMTLGRLDAREKQKGFDELIEAMPALLGEAPDLRCLIAGDGDDRPRLEAKVAAMGLGGKVVFAGRVSEDEKADHYRLCDVFSMAGRQEGFGFVFLEALACGAPVVASELDGSRDAILGGALGELADPDDPASLRAAILRALAKPRLIPERLSEYSFDTFTARLDAIIAPLHPRSAGRRVRLAEEALA